MWDHNDQPGKKYHYYHKLSRIVLDPVHTFQCIHRMAIPCICEKLFERHFHLRGVIEIGLPV